ncbi:MAG: hypothetical protein IKO68_08400 [Oscillospiraceae bacterium]|nr:hypothetical protein [Oscillospiraceae bacterium]
MAQTQHEQILHYIKIFGSITPMEAFQDLGITKLVTRVSELRKAGKQINGTMETKENRFGKPVSFMRYTMGE